MCSEIDRETSVVFSEETIHSYRKKVKSIYPMAIYVRRHRAIEVEERDFSGMRRTIVLADYWSDNSHNAEEAWKYAWQNIQRTLVQKLEN